MGVQPYQATICLSGTGFGSINMCFMTEADSQRITLNHKHNKNIIVPCVTAAARREVRAHTGDGQTGNFN